MKFSLLTAAAAGGNQTFIFGLVQLDGLGRALGHADTAGAAFLSINCGDPLIVHLGDFPRAHPDTGEAGDTLVPFDPGGLAFVEQVLLGNVSLLKGHLPQGLYYFGKTDILWTDEHTTLAAGTVPEQVRCEELLLQPHADHVDDLAGVEIRDRLTYRANAAAGPAGKTAAEIRTAWFVGDLGIKGRVYVFAGKEPLATWINNELQT
jgi:hypothetical protein